MSGPYGGLMRWGECKNMGKLLHKTWAAAVRRAILDKAGAACYYK